MKVKILKNLIIVVLILAFIVLNLGIQFGSSSAATQEQCAETETLQGINRKSSVSFYIFYPQGVVTTEVGKSTEFIPPVTPPEYEIIRYDWDFDGDGLFDNTTTKEEPLYFIYSSAGEYVARVTAHNSYGEKSTAEIKVIVSLPEDNIVRTSVERLDLPALVGINTCISSNPADGVCETYALLISTTQAGSLGPIVKFYEILASEHGVSSENIVYLIIGNEIPTGCEGTIDDIATINNFINAVEELGKKIDFDDLLIVNIDCHGLGYLGYTPEDPRNVAYHGFCYVSPVVNKIEDGDGFDFRESEFELSLFCGRGMHRADKPYWDSHQGLGQWLVSWYPTTEVKRWMYLSHYENIYIEGVGTISDNDEDIDRFIDYTLGDYNKDGRIDVEAGELWDYDGDGVAPYDRYTGIFDEDDWGEIDGFENATQDFHSCLVAIPFCVFDRNLDNRVDIDLYPNTEGQLEVDGTDLDNNGCIDGIDINDDGDMDDWVAIDETICLKDGVIKDDKMAELFKDIECAAKVFIINSCYSGGLINDLSGDETVIMSGSLEISGASQGLLPRLLNEAFFSYRVEADADGNGRVSIMEAFNYAAEHPHSAGLSPGMDLFQYDDNGDRIPHRYPLPDGGDGSFGATIYLDRIEPPRLSIELNKKEWLLRGVRPSEVRDNLDLNGKPVHLIKNTGNIDVAIIINYAEVQGLQAGPESAKDIFATLVKTDSGLSLPIPPNGYLEVYQGLPCNTEKSLDLRYFAPTELSSVIKRMSCVYEIRAYQAVDSSQNK